ncbi:MAG: cation-translocating P-type ATPase [Verrucomicrobia bacterium]|nr:cation-translocating P-type ATPase [Verrucomicrobiota bacterium]
MTASHPIASQATGTSWHNRSAEQVLAQLGSTTDGLTTQEARQRLTTNGPNELKEGKRISPFQIFLGQFKSLLIWILIAAGVISGALGEVVDAIAILAIVGLNAVIGFTADTVERELVFVGLTGMYDPPRQEAKEAVAKCHAAGIRVVMITGDHPHTATAITREIGIASADDVAIAGVELYKMSDDELHKRVSKIAIYARFTAEHKLRIIRAWKANDAVVAMTGDGVNDAPAIKGADIGIAMGRAGTEVTKQAADMIITDDNFATIVAAVEEGRGIYANIRKTLQYLLAGNTGELLLMTVCVIIGLPTPLLPIHLLWINLVTDGLPALCLATDPIDPDVMKRHPRHRSERITNRSFLRTMCLTGFLTAGVAFAVYVYILKTGTPEIARTYAFAVLVFAELLRAFDARSETKPVWRISLFTNRNLLIVVAISFGLQVWSQHNAVLGRFLKTSSMPLADCLLLLALGTVPLLVLELVKVVRHVREHRTRTAKR